MNAAAIENEIREKKPEMPDAQIVSLAAYIWMGWQWDSDGSDGSQNISEQSTGKRAYVRTDGTCRPA